MRNYLVAIFILTACIAGAQGNFDNIDAVTVTAQTANGLTLKEDDGTTVLQIVDGGEVFVTLGDAAGAKFFRLKDSNGNSPFYVDSIGNLLTSESLAVPITEEIFLDGIGGSHSIAVSSIGIVNFTVNGALALSLQNAIKQFLYSNNGVSGPQLQLVHSSGAGTAAIGWEAGLHRFSSESNTGASRDYAHILGEIIDPTNTSEDGGIRLGVTKAGVTALSSGLYEVIISGGAVSFVNAIVTLPEIYAGSAANIDMRLGDNIGATSFTLRDSADLQRGRWDSDGNLSTSGTLNVAGDVTLANVVTGVIINSGQSDSDTSINGDTGTIATFDAGDMDLIIDPDQSGGIDLIVQSAASANLLRTDGTNNRVGIGAAPVSSTTLYVAANNVTAWASYLFNDGNNTNRYVQKLQGGDDAGGDGIRFSSYFDGDGDELAYLKWGGAAMEFVDLSDEREKENIRPTARDALDIVRQIMWRDYNFRRNGAEDTHYMAQQMRMLCPRAVTTIEVDGQERDAINREVASRLFQQAVTMIAQENEALKDRVKTLEARLDAIEAALPLR